MLSLVRLDNSVVFVNFNALAKLLLGLMLAYAFVGLQPFRSGVEALDLSDTGYSNSIRQLFFLTVWALSVFCFVKKRNFGDIRKVAFFVLPLAMCVCSVFWSAEPGITIRRVILLVVTSTSVFCLVSVLSKEDVFDAIFKTLLILVVVSVIAIPIIPGAVHQGNEIFQSGLAGNWKGIFIHKNHAGPAAAVLVFLLISKLLQSRQIIWLIFFAVAFVFLYFTKSKTSLGFLFPAALFAFLYYKVSAFPIMRKIACIFILAFVPIFIFMIDFIIVIFEGILDNPEAFTGRSTMWNLLYQLISDHFFLGVGFGAVWRVGDGMLLAQYAYGWVDWVFTYTHGHNGYLDVTAAIGFVGLLVTLYFLFFKTAVKLSASTSTDFPTFFWCTCIFIFVIFHNFLETSLYSASEGIWLVFLIVFFTVFLKLDDNKISSGS